MIEIGKIYLVNHDRKGQFVIKVTSVRDDFVTGIILNGHTSTMLHYNEQYEGELITIRMSLCGFKEK